MTSGRRGRRAKRGGTLLRATAVREAAVRRSVFRIGAAVGLEYDHARRLVTRLKVRMLDAPEAVSVPFAHLDLRHAERNEVLIRGWPHVPLRPVQGAPVDHLTVRGDTGDTAPLFVHDAIFNALTAEIVSYEIGLLPKNAASIFSLSVPAGALSVRNGQLYLPTPAVENIRRACVAQLGLLCRT